MKHSLFQKCDCRHCEGERFEQRLVLLALTSLAMACLVFWLMGAQ